MKSPGPRLSIVIAVLVFVAPCLADPVLRRYQTTFAGDMLTCRDTVASRFIISPNSQTVSNSTPLPSTTQFVGRPDGFDLVITRFNPSVFTVPLGTISIPGFRFGQVISYRDFLTDARENFADNHGVEFFGAGLPYPTILSSSIFVLGDGAATVGINFMYPVVEYQHDVQIQLISPGGMYNASGRNWEVDFKLLGTLPPGESRTYRVSVRIVPDANDWLRTLVPYRDYFTALYGGVRYVRDPRPVSGLFINNPDCQSTSNPMGFCDEPPARPDIVGWGPLAARFRQRPSLGYHRMMLWRPSGMFLNYPELNFPFQFMTHMYDVPAMAATLDALRAVPSQDLEVGYWWGHSQRVMRGWDNGWSVPFDPMNPTLVARAMQEFNTAVSLNATVIGLDAYIGPPDWTAYQWLRALKLRAPSVKFIMEREWGAPDFLCVMAPTWVNAHDVQTPRLMSDFILPGHETWCGITNADWEHLAATLGHPLTAEDKYAEISRVAQLGYIPVIFDDFNIAGHNFNAAESWRYSIPPDLQSPLLNRP